MVVTVSFSDKMTPEPKTQRSEVVSLRCDYLREYILGRGSGKYKGPEVGECLLSD